MLSQPVDAIQLAFVPKVTRLIEKVIRVLNNMKSVFENKLNELVVDLETLLDPTVVEVGVRLVNYLNCRLIGQRIAFDTLNSRSLRSTIEMVLELIAKTVFSPQNVR